MEKRKTKVIVVLLVAGFLLLGCFLLSRYFVSKLDGTGGISTGYPSESQEIVEILFVGDIMLDRTVRTAIERDGFDYLFADIKNIFEGVDLAVGNLEGTITENASVSQSDHDILRFTFATSTAFSLKELGFTHVSLANNHALDFGEFGLEDTEHYLSLAGVDFFGSPHNDGKLMSSASVKGREICLLGYHQLFNSSISPVISEINSSVGVCDYIVVFAHWGDEYNTDPNESQVKIGHAFVDAGTDLVIGSHPHVVQPIEIYKGRAIFYSLGNFMFDQDFSLATRQGLVVRLELGETTQKFHLIGIEMERSKLYFPEHEAFELSRQVLISMLPEKYKTPALTDGLLILEDK
ncbi:MAG: CapA family protein [Minisyncoccota bacterium]